MRLISRFAFKVQAQPAVLEVVGLHGTDALGECYLFVINLMSDVMDVVGESFLGAPATLTISPAVAGGESAIYHGIVAEFVQLGRVHGGRCYYRATLVPRLSLQSRIRKSEVFLKQDGAVGTKSVCDVLQTLLVQGGLIGGVDYVFQTNAADYPARAFTLQYEESNLDFFFRLMEREGLYSYFDHRSDGECLMVVDSHSMHPRLSFPVRYCPVEGMVAPEDDAVFELSCTWSAQPAEVVARDFNYRDADVVKEAAVAVVGGHDGECAYFGEHLRTETGDGVRALQRRARVRAEKFGCDVRSLDGKGYVVGLRAGQIVSLTGHFNAALNGTYVVTRVEHHGTQTSMFSEVAAGSAPAGPVRTEYFNVFHMIPVDRQFRPERRTPVPAIAGVVGAEVDSEGAGDVAELDEYGRYKIRFHLDRTGSGKSGGKASARVRMAVPFAGDGVGLHFPLCKGAEVVVGFEYGDPDRPVILGVVYNSLHKNVVVGRNQEELVLHTGSGGALYFNYVQGSVCFKGPGGSFWSTGN